MKTALLAGVVCMALVCCATASASAPTTPIDTNICDMDWYYCPRDPGCITYDMSVHAVKVHADGVAGPIKIEDMKAGTNVTVEVTGITTMTETTPSMSYRVYALNGKNMAFGVLQDALTLNGPAFIFEATFTVTADAIGSSGFVEWGLDVFQKGSGTDEAMCVQMASKEYVEFVENKPSPPFEMMCKDLGNGHFVSDVHKIVPKPIPAPQCGVKPAECDLKYYYCPRDPGCITYTMSATSVSVSTDASSIAPNDHIHLVVNGTTHITNIPTAGSYRIYDLAGHNVAAGVLSDAMTLLDCGSMGCHFGIEVNFVLPAQAFTTQGWMSFTLDVFQKKSGSDEGFCVSVSNPSYVTYETSNSPPPGFVTYCRDTGYGHFVKDQMNEIVWDATCTLNA